MTAPYRMGIPEAAAHLSVSRVDIADAINREELPANRSGIKGGRWSIKTTDLEEWSDSRSREPRDDVA